MAMEAQLYTGVDLNIFFSSHRQVVEYVWYFQTRLHELTEPFDVRCDTIIMGKQ